MIIALNETQLHSNANLQIKTAFKTMHWVKICHLY